MTAAPASSFTLPSCCGSDTPMPVVGKGRVRASWAICRGGLVWTLNRGGRCGMVDLVNQQGTTRCRARRLLDNRGGQSCQFFLLGLAAIDRSIDPSNTRCVPTPRSAGRSGAFNPEDRLLLGNMTNAIPGMMIERAEMGEKDRAGIDRAHRIDRFAAGGGARSRAALAISDRHPARQRLFATMRRRANSQARWLQRRSARMWNNFLHPVYTRDITRLRAYASLKRGIGGVDARAAAA
jgi:hypothetical protein